MSTLNDALALEIIRNSPIEVARGNYSDTKGVSHAGMYIAGAAVASPLVIAPGGVLYVAPPGGVQPSISSASANDSAAGTGIQQVRVIYLDSNYIEREEVVTLNGTTPVLMVATNVIFIQCMHGYRFGSLKLAAGAISAVNGANLMSQIYAAGLRCRSSAHMVPAGRRMFIDSMSASSTSNSTGAAANVSFASSEINGWQNPDPTIVFTMMQIQVSDASIANNTSIPMGPFSARTMVCMKFIVDKAATVTASWSGFTEPA